MKKKHNFKYLYLFCCAFYGIEKDTNMLYIMGCGGDKTSDIIGTVDKNVLKQFVCTGIRVSGIYFGRKYLIVVSDGKIFACGARECTNLLEYTIGGDD
jgi:hypothetical protein